MATPLNSSSSLAIDLKDLSQLRQSAQQKSPDALKAAARQFEALFLNMVMKSMREATPQDGMFDSQQGKMYTSMLDQQVSQSLAARGVGLADVLLRQLSSHAMGQLAPGAAAPASPPPPPAMSSSTAQAFQARLLPHAEEASRSTGIPARFMLGQAALESGWGKREIIAADGTASHNLFGIKATGGWKGRVVETATTEYVDGLPQKRIEKFRAYDSYADSFRDYAAMMRNNPRYRNVIDNAHTASGFANGLQRAGYATDPEYAAKLMRIIGHSQG
ncbi:MAG: flagellar assembly peptidoglycan hydrolase FlgJ [Pseudomonadota bacterium]